MNVENNSKYSYEPSEKDLPIGGLGILGLLGLVFSLFPPFTMFAPYPIALAFLLYGRPKAFMLSAFCLIFSTLMVWKLGISVAIFGVFITSVIYALFVSETIKQKIHPIRGVIFSGVTLFVLSALVIFITALVTGVSLEDEITKLLQVAFSTIKKGQTDVLVRGGEEARALSELMKDPRALAANIISWSPAILFITVFVGIWISHILVLFSVKFWKKRLGYPFGLKDLTRFKTPEVFVYPLIFGLLTVLASTYLGADIQFLATVGKNLLACLGIFYFFQGFGIFLDFFSRVRLPRFLRILVVIITALYAWQILALIGVFDMWVDFRRFLKNKER